MTYIMESSTAIVVPMINEIEDLDKVFDIQVHKNTKGVNIYFKSKVKGLSDKYWFNQRREGQHGETIYCNIISQNEDIKQRFLNVVNNPQMLKAILEKASEATLQGADKDKKKNAAANQAINEDIDTCFENLVGYKLEDLPEDATLEEEKHLDFANVKKDNKVNQVYFPVKFNKKEDDEPNIDYLVMVPKEICKDKIDATNIKKFLSPGEVSSEIISGYKYEDRDCTFIQV